MKKVVIFLLTALLSILPARAEKRDVVNPWTAFHRGNELLRQVREAGKEIDPAQLLQAEQHYRACLSQEDSTRDAGTLFDDARYNLELTKLLRAQLGQAATNTGSSLDPSSAARDERREKGASTREQSEDKKDSRTEDEKKDRSPSNGRGQEKANEQVRQNNEKGDSGKGDNKKQAEKQTQQDKQNPSSSKDNKGKTSAPQTGAKNKQDNPKQGQGTPIPRPGGSASGQSNQTGTEKGDPNKKSEKGAEKEQSTSGQGASPGEGESNRSADKGTGSSDVNASNGSAPTEPGQRGGRGQEPGADRFFHPESPDLPRQRPAQPGRGPNGDTRGSGGQSKNQATRGGQDDPVRQAAVMRLQQAIQRIQSKRGRRTPHPQPGGEAPANLKHYRDW